MSREKIRTRRSLIALSVSFLKILTVLFCCYGLTRTFCIPDLVEYRQSGTVFKYHYGLTEFKGYEMFRGTDISYMIYVIASLFLAILVFEIIGRPRIFKAAFSIVAGGFLIGYFAYCTPKYETLSLSYFIRNFTDGGFGRYYTYSRGIGCYQAGFWISTGCLLALVILSVIDLVFALNPKISPVSAEGTDRKFVLAAHGGLGLFLLGMPFPYLMPEFIWVIDYGMTDAITVNRTGEAYFDGYMLFMDTPGLLIMGIVVIFAGFSVHRIITVYRNKKKPPVQE